MVSGIFNGQPMEASALHLGEESDRGESDHGARRPAGNDEGRIFQRRFAIDYLNTAGADKGKRQAGIYALEGDVLTVCVSAPGKPRPTQFRSSKGNGRSLTVWKRT